MFRSAAVLLLSAVLALPAIRAEAQGHAGQGWSERLPGGVIVVHPPRGTWGHRGHDAARDRLHRPGSRFGRGFDRHPDRGFAIPPLRLGPSHRAVPRHDRFERGFPHGDARIAPARCERAYRDQRGLRIGYGARCMRAAVSRPRLLPSACLREVRTPRGARQFYPRACLRRAGWVTSARR